MGWQLNILQGEKNYEAMRIKLLHQKSSINHVNLGIKFTYPSDKGTEPCQLISEGGKVHVLSQSSSFPFI